MGLFFQPPPRPAKQCVHVNEYNRTHVLRRLPLLQPNHTQPQYTSSRVAKISVDTEETNYLKQYNKCKPPLRLF